MRGQEQFLGASSEPENLASFDAALERCGMFRVYREVAGHYVHALPGEQVKPARIDRVLVPTAETREAGWNLGPIGVEAKAGGHRLGPAICQAMDYRRAAFRLPGGFDVILRWVFLFPAAKQIGSVESILAQHGLGVAYWGNRDLLMFVADGRVVCRIGHAGATPVGKMPVSGAKRGSR